MENANLLRALGGLLGLLQQDPLSYLQSQAVVSESTMWTNDEIERLIQQRISARKEGRYSDADVIRKNFLEQGIILEDGPQGTAWRRQ